MEYKFRLISLILIDSIIVLFSIYLSHVFLNPFSAQINIFVFASSIVLLISHHILSYTYHLYMRVWKYANIDEIIGLCKVITLSVVITAVFQIVVFQDLYERALFLTLILHIVLLCGVRLTWRYLQLLKEQKTIVHNGIKRRTLILGAGSTGRSIVAHLQAKSTILSPVVFLDDNPTFKNLELNGIPVVGGLQELESVIEHYRINHIIIAIPSLKGDSLGELIARAKRFTNNVQILPSYVDFATGDLQFTKIRDVSIEDLLGREPITLNNESILLKIKGKKILVTGAGGSIGSELCRQIIKYEPSELILLDHSEYHIYKILSELSQISNRTKITTEIMSVENRKRVTIMMGNHKPDTVFHAAAYKHVPLMEENIYSAIATNILGTKNMVDAADNAKVSSFVLISTDKAVNPSSIMGMTKRIAELVVNEKNSVSDTKYSSVRFGNVLGSSGSVVPLFKKQISEGGPVTVTHPEMTRYFMTIPEAAQLVIQAASFSVGGETFVLDMGQPVNITDLAKKLIKLSGLKEKDIEIQYTGIRDGEKLHEELCYEFEEAYRKVHPKINAFYNNQYIENIESKLDGYLLYDARKLTNLLTMILSNIESCKNVRMVKK
ncbi:polysaccharide biosynthesis protein [Lysinibacillus sp. LZ02]|uniref:polysaccharide biosynthesis protein n=1 Tax=Lysinibacillus sp. LZ02 TaxID=3420668 RepID=UPI003D369483